MEDNGLLSIPLLALLWLAHRFLLWREAAKRKGLLFLSGDGQFYEFDGRKARPLSRTINVSEEWR